MSITPLVKQVPHSDTLMRAGRMVAAYNWRATYMYENAENEPTRLVIHAVSTTDARRTIRLRAASLLHMETALHHAIHAHDDDLPEANLGCVRSGAFRRIRPASVYATVLWEWRAQLHETPVDKHPADPKGRTIGTLNRESA